MKINVVFRLDSKKRVALDQLAKAKGTDRSSLIRDAIDMYLAQYIGEPNIDDIAKRLRDLESRFNMLNTRIGEDNHLRDEKT